MEYFLEDVAGFNNYSGQTSSYNYDFFSKYVDSDILITLIQLSHSYTSIIDLLEKRNNKEESATLQKLNSELKEIAEKISSIKNTQNDLCNNKLDNDSLRKALYESETIDFEKIRELASFNVRIDGLLAVNDIKLETNYSEQKIKTVEHKKLDEKRRKLDASIESDINGLKELLISLNEKNVDVFKGVNIDTLKEQYEQGLVGIIQNTVARKAYVSYVFDIMKRENKHIQEIFTASSTFVSTAKKEDGFEVSELATKDDQIMLTRWVNLVAKEGLRNFGDIWCRNATDQDKSITAIGNGYLQTQPFIDGIYDYISNMGEYNKDNSSGDQAYDKLHNSNNQLHQILGKFYSKDARDIRNIANGIINAISKETKKYGYYQSMEREPYEFAVRVFDMFNSRMNHVRAPLYDKVNTEQQTQSNEQQVDLVEPISPMTNFETTQELTEEQKRMLVNGTTGISVDVLNNDEGLSSGGMRR